MDKFVMSIGAAALLTLFLALVAVAKFNPAACPNSTSVVAPGTMISAAPASEQVGASANVQTESTELQATSTSSQVVDSGLAESHPLSSNPVPVHPSELQKLAVAVHLNQPRKGINRELWAAQLPVAHELLKEMCDCEERNWLDRFVTTGNFALAGSDEYYHSAQILASLPRKSPTTPAD